MRATPRAEDRRARVGGQLCRQFGLQLGRQRVADAADKVTQWMRSVSAQTTQVNLETSVPPTIEHRWSIPSLTRRDVTRAQRDRRRRHWGSFAAGARRSACPANGRSLEPPAELHTNADFAGWIATHS